MKILTVDDSAIVRKIIRSAAQVLDSELEEAENGYDAMSVLEKLDGKVDLILLDWNMPGMNGLEVLKRVKDHEKYRAIPVMMVTSESQKESIVEAVRAGAAHYMVKPFTMDELMKRIMECLGKGGM